MLPLLFLAQSVVAAPLNLTCFGAGTANKTAVTSVYGSNSGGGTIGSTPYSYNGSGSATVTRRRQQGFADQVDIRLFAGDDRIRMPRTMLPPIRGGKDGWFKLKNLVTDARSIRGSVAVNLINNPKLFIDRVTGTISISGKAGDFSGQCEVMTSEAPAKF